MPQSQNPFSLLDTEQPSRPPTADAAASTISSKNPFLAIDAQADTEQQQLRLNAQDAAQTTPDKRAESMRLSLRTGLPTSVIERNFDEIRNHAQIAETPYAQIQRESPAVTRWAQEPDHAAVAADDMENLGFLEWVLSAPSKAFAQTTNQIRYSELRYKSMFASLSQDEHDAMNAFKFHSTLGGQLGAGKSWFRQAVTGTGQLLAQSVEPAKYAVVGGLEGLPIGAAGGFVLGGGVGAIPGALATGAITARAGLTYGVFKTTAMQETAQAYDEMLEFRDEHGLPLDPTVAKMAALTVGGLNGVLEKKGLDVVLRRFPGLKFLSGGATRNAMKQALRNPTVRAAFLKLAKDYGTTLSTEVATEVAQRGIAIAAEEMAKLGGGQMAPGMLEEPTLDLAQQPRVTNPDGSISTVDSLSVNLDGKEVLLPTVTAEGVHFTGENAAAEAIAEFKKTGRHLGKFETPAAATAFGKQVHEDYAKGVYDRTSKFRTFSQWQDELVNEAAQAIPTFALGLAPGPILTLTNEITKAKRADQAKLLFTALGEGAANSKTLARMPEAVQKLAHETTKDGPITHVYAPLDTFTTYWQSKGVDPAAMAAELTGKPDAYADAIRHQGEGGDLEIPTAIYTAKLAGTEHNAFFANELRLGSPNELNGREAELKKASLTADMKAAIAEAVASPEQQAFSALHDQIRQQLTTGGKFQRAPAEHIAALVQAGFGAMATRAGFDPLAIYQGLGLRVQRTDVAGREAAAAVPRDELAQGERVPLPANETLSEPPGGGVPGPGPETMPPAMAGLETPAPAVERPNVDEPLNVMSNLGAAAVRMMTEDPGIIRRAQEMRFRAAQVPRTIDILERQASAAAVPAVDQPPGPANVGGIAAKFIGWQPGFEDVAAFPLYNIEGGPSHGTTVGADDLTAAGIPIPETPPLTEFNQLAQPIQTFYQSGETDPQFYSRLVRAVEGAKQNRATGKEWKAMIRNAKIGINQDEFAIARVDDLKDGSSYAKDEVLEYLRANVPQLTAVVLEGESAPDDDDVRERAQEIHDEAVSEAEGNVDLDEIIGRATTYEDEVEEETRVEDENGDPVLDEDGDEQYETTYVTRHYPAIDGGYKKARRGYGVTSRDEVEIIEDSDAYDDEDDAQAAAEKYLRNIDMEPFWEMIREQAEQDVDFDDAMETAREELGGSGEDGVHYKQYSLPGQEDNDTYREVFVAVEPISVQNTLDSLALTRYEAPFDSLSDEHQSYIRNELANKPVRTPKWKDGHDAYDFVENPIVRVRLNIRTTEATYETRERRVIPPDDPLGLGRWFVIVSGPQGQNLETYENSYATEQEARDAVAAVPTQDIQIRGKTMLFLEEVQPPSGEKTFLVTPTRQLVEGELIPRPLGEAKTFTNKAEADRYAKEISGVVTKKLTGEQGKMPDLFIDNWREIGFKWALKYAAELDVDGVAWTTGKQQADRYDRRKVVKSIAWVPFAIDLGHSNLERVHRTVTLTLVDMSYDKPMRLAVDAQGIVFHATGTSIAGQLQGHSLSSVIGPDLSEQIMAGETGTIEGKGLRVGGAGLIKLYEVDFRNVVNKIDAIKKHGGKASAVPIVQKLEYTVHQMIGDEYQAKLSAWRAMTDDQRRAIYGAWTAEDVHGGTAELLGPTLAASAITSPGGEPRYFFEVKDENEDVIKEFINNTLAYEWLKRNRFQPIQQPAILLTPEMKAAIAKGGSPMFQGAAGGRRGSITFEPGRTTINLFASANLSTFLHETGHLFLEVMRDLDGRIAALDPTTLTLQQAKLQGDYAAILAHVGAKPGDTLTTEQHELFARTFEAYLREGKAPSQELRGAFARFGSWLVGIYKSLTALNAPMTPEIRQVMDRMIATDEAIAVAESDGHLQALFLTPDQAQMSPARFALYREGLTAASLRSREALLAQQMSEVHREQTKQWKQAQGETRAQVEREVYAMPVYKALAAMSRGMNPDGSSLVEGEPPAPMRLSKQMLVESLGADRLRQIPRTIYTTDQGLDPETIADAYGFSSPDAMLSAIAQAKPMKSQIAQETEKRMLQEHGAIMLDGTLHEKAQAAALDESRDVVLRDEMAALIKMKRQASPFERLATKEAIDERIYERRWLEAEAKLRIAIAEGHQQVEIDKLKKDVRDLKAAARSGPKAIRDAVPKADVLRELAQATVARMKVSELNPARFWTAVRRASDKAVAAAGRQDFDGAIVAKQEELINAAIFREIVKVKHDVETRVAAARNLGKPAMLRRLLKAGEGYHDQVADILDRYEFAQVPAKALARRGELRKFLTGVEAQGLPVDVPLALLDSTERINYKELTVQELVGITDGLQSVLHLARLKNRLLQVQEKRAFDVVRNSLAASIRLFVPAQAPRLEFRPGTLDEKLRKIDRAIASHRKVAFLAEKLDGGNKDGPATRLLVRPLNQAGDAKELRNLTDGAALWAIVRETFPAALTGELNKMAFIPAIGGSLSLEGRIAIALNMGTKTGLDRVLSDPRLKVTREQAQAIVDTLDKQHWDFIEKLWGFVGKYRQEIIDLERKVNGVAPVMVEGIDVPTKFGTIKGAYYPLQYDTRLAPRAAQLEEANAARASLAATYVRQTTAHGFTEKRLEHVELPLRLDLGVAFHHVDQVIHYLTHRIPLMDVTRLLRDPVVAKAIHETAGDNVYRQFTSLVADLAVGALPGGEHLIDDAAAWVRPRLQLAALGLNVWTSVQQPLGLFNGMDEIGVANVIRGMRRWLSDAATMENTVAFVVAKSAMMATRVGSSTQDLSDLRQSFRTAGGFFDRMVRAVTADVLSQQAILDGMLWHIGMMQRVADMPVWLGKYEAALREDPSDDARAVALADEAVLKSQGSGNIKDLAGVQRGRPAVRAWLMFYSYGNLVLNQNIRAFERTRFTSPTSLAKFLGSMSLINLLPAFGTVFLGMLLKRRKAPDDPEKFADWWIAEVAKETLSGALNGLVLIRELTPILTDGARGYEGPSGARFIAGIYKLAGQVKQGEVDDALWKAANATAGVVFGYPATQTQRTVEGWRALATGKETNPLVLVTGPAPAKVR